MLDNVFVFSFDAHKNPRVLDGIAVSFREGQRGQELVPSKPLTYYCLADSVDSGAHALSIGGRSRQPHAVAPILKPQEQLSRKGPLPQVKPELTPPPPNLLSATVSN